MQLFSSHPTSLSIYVIVHFLSLFLSLFLSPSFTLSLCVVLWFSFSLYPSYHFLHFCIPSLVSQHYYIIAFLPPLSILYSLSFICYPPYQTKPKPFSIFFFSIPSPTFFIIIFSTFSLHFYLLCILINSTETYIYHQVLIIKY